LDSGADGCAKDTKAAEALIRQAAELGQRYRWWGRATARNVNIGITRLISAAGGSGRSPRVVLELGAALSGRMDEEMEELFEMVCDAKAVQAARLCIRRYEKWCEEAKEGVRCWLLAARRQGVVKDVRVMVARMLWEQRAFWGR
jgi:hypothetical protein